MLKKILMAMILVILIFIGIVFYLVNPFDKQYRSFDTETKARNAFSDGDIDSFIKIMNNPVTLKYHAPFDLYLTLTYTGKYDEAQNAVNSFVRFVDYGYCVQYNPNGRAICRVKASFRKDKPVVDKNKWLSIINFEKGDYEKAKEYNLKSNKQSACFNVKLYSALGDFKEADKNLQACETAYSKKKVKTVLYRTKGFYYMQKKQYDEAESYLKKSITSRKARNFQGNNATYLLLAQLYTDMKNNKKAQHYYELVLKTDPYCYKAKKGLELLKK